VYARNVIKEPRIYFILLIPKFDRIQLANLLVLSNLFELSHQLGFDERKRVEYATRLGQLRSMICKLEALESKRSAKAALAA
jgi:hypothetical protein